MKFSATWLLAAGLAVLPGAALAGLEFCNNGSDKISVAIGYKDGEWTSEGWWAIAAGDCKTVIAGKLPRRYYYYRVSGAGSDFEGEGYYFCTISEAFTIVGDTECAQRGYRRENFAELNVGEATSYSVALEYRQDSRPGLLSIDTGTQPGVLGEPFSIVGNFNECVFEGDYNYCGFAADGWRWMILDDGRTSSRLLDGMSRLPPGSPIHVTGDLVSYGDITVEAVARSLQELVPTENDRLLMAMQGRWQSAEDPLSEIEISGTTQYNWYQGMWMGESVLRVDDTCDASAASGTPHLIATELETQESLCYAIDKVSGGWMELMYLPAGNFLSYRKVR